MKLKIALPCLGIFLGSLFHQATAQNITVSGNVKNKSTGQPLSGASVTVSGTSKSTATNNVGDFSISVSKGATLVITNIGMDPIRYRVTTGGPVQILMEESSKSLDEVVVIGYGTQKVTKVSGAISTVKSADIQKINPVRVEEALQGRASGVTVIQSGSPGSKPTVLIRGIPSFTGTDPVVIIDGVPQTLTDFNSINPSDIESINVLKDAATTAIYGVKGGNGVILVTTKTGRKNKKAEINLNSNYGVQEVMNTIGVLKPTKVMSVPCKVVTTGT